ncbi:MAG: insulinase family protein, partial [marine benthic group bacterium]|nr:insulinase family protein [Gemmatimonadota bacterium]
YAPGLGARSHHAEMGLRGSLTSHGSGMEAAFRIEQRTLANGLRVIVHPDGSAPLVATHLMYHVGSRHEPPGRRGFAHLFEHLLFQGSENVPEGEHFRRIQAAGGTLNGTTWFDRTNYYETLPSGDLDLALWLESDRMGFFLPAITQEKLDNQRDVVKNERRQSYENRPYGLAVETMLELAYPPGHPYRHPTIGYMEDLDAASLVDVRGWFESWYGPNNAVLVISGAVDPEAAFARAEHWFGEIPARVVPESVPVPVVTEGVKSAGVITDRVSVPRVYLMFHAPAFPDPEFEPADVLCSLLSEGKSSRLYRSLVYDARIAADVSAFVWPTECAGMLWVVATGRPGVEVRELESAISEVLEPLRADGPTEHEIEGARNRARRQLLRQLDSVTRRADLLAHAAVLRGDPDYLNQVGARYESISGAEVAAAAASILDPSRRTAVHVIPRTEG